MCLNPLTIRNPTKVIHNLGGHQLTMQVPCGICAECLQSKRNEWYIRTHYEIQRTLSLGGFVYFDTLTYANEHLPKLSHFLDIGKYGINDFSCFNHEHFKGFLKRMRRRISYHYGIKKNAFRYFLTTEYGEDERYTHRPHYHILFFVYADIPPIEFSEIVSSCWSFGRTDGFPFKPYAYVHKHVYGLGKNEDFTSTTAVAMYVSKYITKSSTFCKKLRERIKMLRVKIAKYNSLGNHLHCDDDEDMIKKLIRNIDMFHRQSQGFGLSFLDNLSPEVLMFIECDKIMMRDKDAIVKTYPMPMYYKRKLFYNIKKHEDGSTYWELSDAGLKHVLNSKLRNVEKLALKYMDIVRNCSNQEYIDKFFNMLGDRDISDYVIYEQYYKGRHRHVNAINYKQQQTKHLIDEEDNLYDWISSISLSARPYSDRSNTLALDEIIMRCPIRKKEEIDELELMKFGHGSHMSNNSHSELISTYIHRYKFNENSDPKFNHYH